jgi:GMP synthase-like glutamine amidotransferase
MGGDLHHLVCIRHHEGDDLGVGHGVLSEMGLDIRYVSAWSEPIPEVGDIPALVVLGGSMNADEVERFPFLGAERALLQEVSARQIPLLGICLGAQALARARGAAVPRSPVKEFGFVRIHLTEAGETDPLLSCFQEGDRVMAWHEDTFDMPDGAVLLATGDAVRHQAYRLGVRAWAVQFHIEVTKDMLHRWVDSYGDRLEPTWGRSSDSVRADIAENLPLQQERARVLFAQFGEVVAASHEARLP